MHSVILGSGSWGTALAQALADNNKMSSSMENHNRK